MADAAALREALDLPAGGAPSDNAAVAASRTLGARWLVVGGYQLLGGSIRITARLFDVEAGGVHGTAKIDARLDDLFRAQDELAARLGDLLAGGGGAVAKRRDASAERGGGAVRPRGAANLR